MAAAPPDKQGLSMMWWSARHPPANPTTSFQGKTILITGANVGLGFETALKFAQLNAARLILAVRSLNRGEEAKSELCRRSGFAATNIHLYQFDMSTFEGVKTFADNLVKHEPRLDIAVLNAGIAASSYNLSPENFEMTLQVNVLSTTLLAILLLPILHQSSQLSNQSSHLEFVGSVAHHYVEADTLDISGKQKLLQQVNTNTFFNVERQYAISKLLLMYAMDGLLEIVNLQKFNVIMTTACPGLCRTNLGRDFSLLLKIPVGLFQLVFARSAEEGSRTLVSGVSMGSESNGQFWSHDVFYK